jgi:hypothetical protein
MTRAAQVGQGPSREGGSGHMARRRGPGQQGPRLPLPPPWHARGPAPPAAAPPPGGGPRPAAPPRARAAAGSARARPASAPTPPLPPPQSLPQSWGLLLGAVFMNPKTAQTVASVMMLAFMLVGAKQPRPRPWCAAPARRFEPPAARHAPAGRAGAAARAARSRSCLPPSPPGPPPPPRSRGRSAASTCGMCQSGSNGARWAWPAVRWFGLRATRPKQTETANGRRGAPCRGAEAARARGARSAAFGRACGRAGRRSPAAPRRCRRPAAAASGASHAARGPRLPLAPTRSTCRLSTGASTCCSRSSSAAAPLSPAPPTRARRVSQRVRRSTTCRPRCTCPLTPTKAPRSTRSCSSPTSCCCASASTSRCGRRPRPRERRQARRPGQRARGRATEQGPALRRRGAYQGRPPGARQGRGRVFVGPAAGPAGAPPLKVSPLNLAQGKALAVQRARSTPLLAPPGREGAAVLWPLRAAASVSRRAGGGEGPAG